MTASRLPPTRSAFPTTYGQMSLSADRCTARAELKTRVERRRIVPRGEGLSRDKSTGLRSLRQTYGRFSVRGPAAWRLDGGTGKETITRLIECKGLPNRLWDISANHKQRDCQVTAAQVGSLLSGGYPSCNQDIVYLDQNGNLRDR